MPQDNQRDPLAPSQDPPLLDAPGPPQSVDLEVEPLQVQPSELTVNITEKKPRKGQAPAPAQPTDVSAAAQPAEDVDVVTGQPLKPQQAAVQEPAPAARYVNGYDVIADRPIIADGVAPFELGNDMASSYMQHAQTLDDAAVVVEAQRRLDPKSAREPTWDEIVEQHKGLERGQAGAKPPQAERGMLGKVAADVGTGFREFPSAAATGSIDAVRNSLKAGNDFADWIATSVGLPDIPVTGEETVDRLVQAFLRPGKAVERAIPKFEKPTSVTGHGIYEIARFFTGFFPALKGMRALGAGEMTAQAVAGGLPEFFTQDPNASNAIGTLVKAFPSLQGPVTDLLATDPNDPQVINRLRHAVEGIGFGYVSEGVLKAIRWYASGRRAAREAAQLQAAQQAAAQGQPGAAPLVSPTAQAAGGAERDVLWLGSPDAPLIVREQPSVTGQLATAAQQTEPGVPMDVVAKGMLTKVASDIDPVPPQFRNVQVPTATARTDPTGIWFLDGDKPVFAAAGKAGLQDQFGSRAVEFNLYPSVAARAPNGSRAQFWYKPGEEARAKELAELWRQNPNAGGKMPIDEWHRRNGALLGYSPESVDAYVAGVGKGGPPGEFYVNFGRIMEPDDVQSVIRQMADGMKPELDVARRGVQSHAETVRLANQLGMTVERLMARRSNTPLPAEEAIASRQFLNASAEKLAEAVNRAALPNAGAMDFYNLRRMMTVHQAIQLHVFGARTEAARTLNSYRIPVGPADAHKLGLIDEMIEQTGGAAVTQELARRMQILLQSGASQAALSNAARMGMGATTTGALREMFVSGLLWLPPTHVVNIASNIITMVQQVYERTAAHAIGNVLGTAADNKVVSGEALSMLYGIIAGQKDAIRLAGKAFMSGESASVMKHTDTIRHAITSQAFAHGFMGKNILEAAEFSKTMLGRGIDFIGHAVRFPQRPLAAVDEYFKAIGYRMELQAQALRQATNEGLTGPALASRITELTNTPPASIRMAAINAGDYNTFQTKLGPLARSVSAFREAGGSLNPTVMIVPFIRTPANILRYNFERSPLQMLTTTWRADIAAGGARRDLAVARIVTGTAIMAQFLDWASSGAITGAGPRDPGKRESWMRDGWRPYSIRLGDKYYSYARFDPIATPLGFAATIAEKMREYEHNPEEFDTVEEIMATGIAAISVSVLDKTYFTGITQLVDMFDKSEQSETQFVKWSQKQVAALTPFNTLLSAIERGVDPQVREINGYLDAIKARIPGLSGSLFMARDLWGRPQMPDEPFGRAYNVFIPAPVGVLKANPIDEEMANLRMGITRIKKKDEFEGATIDFMNWPEVYDEYVRLAGNEYKHPVYGLGAMDLLNNAVTGGQWSSIAGLGNYQTLSDGPEGGKAQFIKNIVAEYRQLARNDIMTNPKFADFQAHVRAEAEKRADRQWQYRQDVMPRPNVPAINVPLQ